MNQAPLSRLPGIVFAVVVLIAVGALLLGFGVPVGVGAVAGLVLGGIAGLMSVLWLARGPGRSMTVGSMSWSSTGNSERLAEPDLDELRAMSELSEIDLGRVDRVAPVLATEEAAELTVSLVSMTAHEAGLRLDVEVRPAPGTADPGHMARVSVSDAAGTRYRALGQRTGGSHPARYEVRVLPRPPVEATEIAVRIESFVDPFPGRSRQVDGPWTFVVPFSQDT